MRTSGEGEKGRRAEDGVQRAGGRWAVGGGRWSQRELEDGVTGGGDSWTGGRGDEAGKWVFEEAVTKRRQANG